MRKMMIFSLLILFSCMVYPACAGDEQWINSQLDTGYCQLESGKIYTISDSINLKDNCILAGGQGSVIKLIDNAGWETWKPLISGQGVQNVIIQGIEFDVNAGNQNNAPKWKGHSGNGEAVSYGMGNYNVIHVIDCDNVSVSDCLFHNGLCDGFRAKTSTNIFFINNTAYELGHDCFYAIDCQNVVASGNNLKTRTNAALRLWNSQHVRFFNNFLTAQPDGKGGNAVIQIEYSKDMENTDVEVCNNKIYQSWGSGVWAISYGAGAPCFQNVVFRNNLLTEPAITTNIPYAAGFTISGVRGTTITNNVFDSSHNAGVLVLGGGANTTITDNIITNTLPHNGVSQAGTGSGINNRIGAALDIIGNCFFGNSAGDTYGCTDSSPDLQDPKAHQTSSGWWWDSALSTWGCKEVPASELGMIAPTSTRNTTDRDTHEVEFNDIFDILEIEFPENATSNIQPDELEYSVQDTEQGKIYGGVKIAGWNNLTYIDDTAYVSSPEDAIIQSKAIRSPSLELWNGYDEEFTKNITTDLDNNTHIATAKMNVDMKYYTVKQDKSGKHYKKYSHASAEFTDIYKNAPAVFSAPAEVVCYVNVYTGSLANYIEATVPEEGLKSVTYACNGKSTDRVFLLGERHWMRNGGYCTNYSRSTYWDGELPHNGNYIHLTNITDPAALQVTAHSLYGDVPVKYIIEKHSMIGEAFHSYVFRVLSYVTLLVGFFVFVGRIPFRRY